MISPSVKKSREARSIATELPRFSHLGGDILPGHDCVDGLFTFASLNRHWTPGKVDSSVGVHHAKMRFLSLPGRFWVVFA